MSDLGSKSALQTDCDAKVTTNGANENTGARVRAFLTNFIDTVYAAFQGYGSNVTAAGTVDFGAQPASFPLVGTTTITSFGTAAAGVKRTVICGAATPITYNAVSLIIPGSASITTAAEDKFTAMSLGSGNWIITDYTRRNGLPLVSLTKSNVGLGNVDNTSDANKPVSTAQQTALDLKADATALNAKAEVRVDGVVKSGTYVFTGQTDSDGRLIVDLNAQNLTNATLISGCGTSVAFPFFVAVHDATDATYTVQYFDTAGAPATSGRDVTFTIAATHT